ncbi:hypothetical protein FRC09_014077 [Ceratobasidium sp. 395]|nr:hypothetical protein FRC09_014077 [Ceratobasidium sp. 395]
MSPKAVMPAQSGQASKDKYPDCGSRYSHPSTFLSMSRSFAFPSNSNGPALVYFLVASLAFSVTSFALNFRYYFGWHSIYITPVAWLLTTIHHIVLYCVLPRRRRDEQEPENMPRCVKHAGNIWCLHYLSFFWLGGGITTLVVTALIYPNYEVITRILYVNFVSAGLAILESILLMAMCIVSWKALSKEGYDGAVYTAHRKDSPGATNVDLEAQRG